MCHVPCCGTPWDMELLILSGYGDQLMYDDLLGGEKMLKPALKGYEGQFSPWQTASHEGCTFWLDGKCQLHNLGIKPTQGKLAHHDLSNAQHNEIAELVNDSWRDGKGDAVIEKWMKINNHTESDEPY